MNINATLIGQSVAFFIFVVFCMKFVWPPVITALRERQKKIADGLDAASRANRDLELAQEKVAHQLRDAKSQAAEILEQAKKRANQIVDAAKVEAIAEGGRQKALVEAEIAASANRAREDLRKQVSTLAVAGAEKLLHREIDANAHKALLDELAAQLSDKAA